MTKKQIEFRRINLNLPVHIIEQVNEYARSLGINNVSAYIVLLNQALEQRQTLSNLPDIFTALSQIATVMPKNSMLLENDNIIDSNDSNIDNS